MADITITLAQRTPPSNPEQSYGTPCVIAPGSSGAYDTIVECRSAADIALLGWGPITHIVANALKRAGGPVFALRSRSTAPGAIWGNGLVKEPGGRATLYVYGRVKLSGADANGDLTWGAKALGVSLQVQSGGALAAVVNGKAILLTIPAATPASDVVTFWNGADPGAVQAAALATIKAEGTGASDAGTTLAAYAFDLGTLAYVGIDSGYRVYQKENGNNTALSSSYSTKDLTINLHTDADGTAISTANDVVAIIAAGAVGKFTIIPVSDGTGLAGTQSGLTAIPFGSSGAVSASGTPYDRANLVVECLTVGTVGGSPAPVIQWAIDFPRREDARTFGRGNASLALLARRSGLRAQITQQTGNSKSLTHSFDGVTLNIQLGTTSGGVPNSTAAAVQAYVVSIARLRAAYLAFLPTGDGSDVMEVADIVRLTAPSVTYSAPTQIPVSGVVPIKNGAVDTGVMLTFTGVLDVGDKWAAQFTAPASSVDDMASAAAAMLADQTRRASWITYGSPVSRTQASTISTQIQGALNSKQEWALLQVAEWDPESQTFASWEQARVADWLGFDDQLLAVCAGECTNASAYTGRAMTQPAIAVACGTAALAPYHQDLGKVKVGPTSGIVPDVTGLWCDTATDTTLADNRFITLRTDEDAPGAIYFRNSPTMAEPNNTRNRLQYLRTDLVVARETKLTLRQFRNSPLDYQTTLGDDGTPVGALTKGAAADVEGACNASVAREMLRKKLDGEVSVSPLASGQKFCVVDRNQVYYNPPNPATIYVECGAAKRPPAERGRITVYDRPE